MDILAGELGIDRAEIRRRNFVRPDEFPYTSVTHHRYDSGDYATALDSAPEAIGYDAFAQEQEEARAEGKLLGLGFPRTSSSRASTRRCSRDAASSGSPATTALA